MSRPGRPFYLLLAVAAVAGGILIAAVAVGLHAAVGGGVVGRWIAMCGVWIAGTLPLTRPLAAGGALAAGAVLWRGAGVLAADLRRTRSAVRALRSRPLPRPPAVEAAVCRAGIAAPVEMLRADALLSFASGYLRPQICVSDALAAGLSDRELEALLLHEDYHCRARDPLKSLVADSVTGALFFLPLLPVLRRRYLWARELAADRYAVGRQGNPAGLAGALLKVAAGPAMPAFVPAASGVALTLIDARIDQLTGGHSGPARDIAWRPAVATALWLTAAAVAVRWLGAADGGRGPTVSGPTGSVMGGGMRAGTMMGVQAVPGAPVWVALLGAAALVGLAWLISKELIAERR